MGGSRLSWEGSFACLVPNREVGTGEKWRDRRRSVWSWGTADGGRRPEVELLLYVNALSIYRRVVSAV